MLNHSTNNRKAQDLAHSQKVWMQGVLWVFLIVSLLGVLLRYQFVSDPLPFDYQNLLHAHSHLAMMGWAYQLVAGALVFLTLWPVAQKKPVYKHLFVANMIAVAGMVPAFIYQGYGAWSIGFCTIHLITVYVFAWHYLKDMRSAVSGSSAQLIRWSIYWLLISTIGVWAIGPVSVLLGKAHPLYHMSIQFFLHFQFNGWFTYAALGLLVHQLLSEGCEVSDWKLPVRILNLSIALTYFLSILQQVDSVLFIQLNAFGSLLQLVAVLVILLPFFNSFQPERKISWIHVLLVVGVSCLVLKVLLQAVASLPFIGGDAFALRDNIVAFIHLTMLGGVTLTVVAILLKNQLLPSNILSQWGWQVFLTGFVAMEMMLFGHQLFIQYVDGGIYYPLLLGFTTLLPTGIFLLVTDASTSVRFQMNMITIKNKQL